MHSKVKEYIELYNQFDLLCEKLIEAYNPIQDIEERIANLENEKAELDYNNTSIMISNMEQYYDDQINVFNDQLVKDVNVLRGLISNPSSKTQSNYETTCKCIGRSKVYDFLTNTPIDFSQEINSNQSEESSLSSLSTVNSILSFIFRFNFISSIPKFARVVAGIVAWFILFGLVNAPFWLIMLAFVSNVTIYVIMKKTAKDYLKINQAICLGMISQQNVIDQYNNYRREQFKINSLDPWKTEINNLRNNGLEGIDQSNPNSLYAIVKNELMRKYNDIENQIAKETTSCDNLQMALNKVIEDIEEFAPSINSKETIVDDLVVDKEYNNGVLSPYVSLGFASREAFGIKELVYIEHDIKPVIITYSTQTYKNGDYFRKTVARIIEQLMKGFYEENYYDFINMVLVDFESLHFPHSRTNGLMKVVRGKEGFNELMSTVVQNRNEIDYLEDGKISTINPIRLKNKENVFKYNVAYFVGVDFNTIDRDVLQLFTGGQHFGFVPFVFLQEDFANSLLDEKNSSKLFSNVIEDAYNNERIYSMEDISNQFEYDVVVSDRKELILEKLAVNRLYSFDEFLNELENSEESISDECIYIDVNDLTETTYEKLLQYEEQYCYRYFTIGGQLPEFMNEDIIMSM